MTGEAWLTLGVVVVLCGLLVTDRVAPTIGIGTAVILLYLTGIVDAAEAFGGFANPAPWAVAGLYVLAGAAEATGALSGLSNRVLGPGGAGDGRRSRRTLARIAYPAAGASAFLPNTPLVAMMAPRVAAWARRRGQPASRFLMPLSFAAIVGGVITVIGTSTNLIVSGLLESAGRDPLRVFSITPVGLPVAVLATTAMVLLAPRLLPVRRAPAEDLGATREFTVEMLVEARGPLPGTTVTDAGMRNLEGVYLVEIERSGRIVSPVGPDEVLGADDRLVFAGDIGRIVDLQGVPGLRLAEEHHFARVDTPGQRFYQVVVAPGSPLDGSTLRDTDFRNRYGAAVVAVHRAGVRVGGKIGETRLRAGDVLLAVSDPGFTGRMRDQGDFLVVAPLEETTPPLRRHRARIVEVAALAFVVVAATGLMGLTQAALAVALALVALRVVTPAEARRSVNLNIILMIAFSIGLGNTVATSGLADETATRLLELTDQFGDVGILAGVMLATVVMTELLTNNAAAAIVFPVALATAAATGVELEPLAIGILVMASCSFLSPIGYQTNTMVFGMGGYRFLDFARLGLPLTAIVFVTTLLVIPLVFPLR